MSAPNSNGRQLTGVGNVLSTIRGTPCACAAAANNSMSSTVRDGLDSVSAKTALVLCVLACVGLIFAPKILGVFSSGESEVMNIGARALRFQCLTFPLAAWIVMCNMMTQTIGKAVRASFMAMARQGIFFIPTVLILPRLFGLTGLQCSQPISDIITFAVSIPLQISILREMKETTESPLKQQ